MQKEFKEPSKEKRNIVSILKRKVSIRNEIIFFFCTCFFKLWNYSQRKWYVSIIQCEWEWKQTFIILDGNKVKLKQYINNFFYFKFVSWNKCVRPIIYIIFKSEQVNKGCVYCLVHIDLYKMNFKIQYHLTKIEHIIKFEQNKTNFFSEMVIFMRRWKKELHFWSS